MHELSIAYNIVETAKEHLLEAPGAIVRSIRLRIGKLSCVHRDSLNFSFELITADTPLQCAALIIEEVPVVVFCPNCNELRELPGIQRFECPVCQTRTGDIRQGKELEIESIEVEAESEPEPESVAQSSCFVRENSSREKTCQFREIPD